MAGIPAEASVSILVDDLRHMRRSYMTDGVALEVVESCRRAWDHDAGNSPCLTQ